MSNISKEEGESLIKTIESYHKYYDYYEYTTNFGCLCRVYYFDIEEEIKKKEVYVGVNGCCPHCGSDTFVEVPRVPGTVFDYGEPELMCKECHKIVDENDFIYERCSN